MNKKQKVFFLVLEEDIVFWRAVKTKRPHGNC